MAFAKTKTEKVRLARKVRAQMSQYNRMQDTDLRETFPQWFEMEDDALASAKVALDMLIAEHNREVYRRARQAAKEEL